MNEEPSLSSQLDLTPETISELIWAITEQTSKDDIRRFITQVANLFWVEPSVYDLEKLVEIWEKLLSVAPAEPAFNTSISFMLKDWGDKPAILSDVLNTRRLAAIQSYRQRLVQRVTPPPSAHNTRWSPNQEMLADMKTISQDTVDIADFWKTLFPYFRLRWRHFAILPGWQRAATILLWKVRKRADFEQILKDSRNRSVINPIFSDWDNFPYEDFVASFPKPLKPFEYNWIYSQLIPKSLPIELTEVQKAKRRPLWDYLEEYKNEIQFKDLEEDFVRETIWNARRFWRDEYFTI
jgi:hypothetical protein